MPPDSLLPDAGPPQVLMPAPTPDRPLAGLVILAVEDSRYACEALRLICHRLGARLRRAETLAAAAVHLRTYRPDVVMIDLGLPDGRGDNLIARLAVPGTGGPVILGMSGEDGGEQASLAAGAAGHLTKPIESIRAFGDRLLALLPGRGMPHRPAAVPAPVLPVPDRLALRDDLGRAAACLYGGGSAAWVPGFLTGLARATRDPALERAAHGPQHILVPLLHDRLACLDALPPFSLN